MNPIVIIIIVAVALACFYGLYSAYKKLTKNNKKTKQPKQKKIKTKNEDKRPEYLKKLNLELIDKFMFRRQLLFWKYLNTILPRSCVVCAKVAATSLVVPVGEKTNFNQLHNKYLDYVVFDEATMRPVLVIDIYDKSFEDGRLSEDNPFVYEAITKVGLPVLEIFLQQNFDYNEVKNIIYDKLKIQKGD